MRTLLLCLAVCNSVWCVTAMTQSRSQGADKPLMTLVEQLKPPFSTTERVRAAEALEGYGESAVAPVTKLLRSGDRRTRKYACLALTRLGPCAEAAVPDLTAIVADSNSPLRREAVIALGRIGPAASDATPVLCRVFREDDEILLRDCVVETLADIGKGAVRTLAENLQSGDIAVCQSVCVALQRIGPEAKEALPALIALVSVADQGLRDAIFLALAQMGAPAVGDLTRMLQHEDKHMRRLAAMALSKMSSEAAPAVRALCHVTGDPEADVRFWAVRALARIGESGHGVSDCLVRASLDEDADVRWQAAVAMRATRVNESSQQALRSLLNDAHPAVRAEVEAALGNR
ncbi:MAG: HEAT repeat domain-containing protein [Planctomycetes bacterium]|nr:HEAT repeat domain-containing protein [Planctomycetota bacterium]MBL7042468.1 HEAT repeat domain-containing protein [Pirellulaceae bacterium]